MSSSFDTFTDDLNVNSSSTHHFSASSAADHEDEEEDTYSGYGGYSSFTGGFSPDGDVAVDHAAAASPEIYGFSDPNPGYSQSPSESVTVENGNENGNDYGDDVFVSDSPVLPPPGDMEPEEGYALREWRRLYTEEYFLKHMSNEGTPEIQRSNLVSCVIQLKALGIDNILGFDWPASPSPEAMIRALEVLYSRVLDDDAKLTSPTGFQVAEIPLVYF